MAGSRSDLGGLAWVECKHCRYRGVGLGRETLRHTGQHQGHSSPLSLVERLIVLLRQLSYAIKNQLVASKAPY